MAAKREDAQRAAAETEELKQKQQAQNQQDFDDLLKGKAPRKRTEDMNLQELFKTYYTKAREADKSAYINSAKGSLNSFSSYLEMKREKARK